ncbi:MAG TPA: hypothetical protein VMT38_09225 [Terracidiphilus sp.]|nr:hypothetical protein [Terracidiphilus sp.]
MGNSLDRIADLVWPALALVQRMLSVVPIVAGLIVEWLALWLGGFGLKWKKAIVVDVVMNAASALIGLFLIPALGMGWHYGPGQLIDRLIPIGMTFHIDSLAAYVIAVAVTTAIEAAVVRWGFKIRLGARRFAILLGANAISVGFAFVSVIMHPAPLPGLRH